LKQVFGHFTLSREKHEVAHQAMLMQFNQAIQQLRILQLQPTRNLSVFTLYLLNRFGGKKDGLSQGAILSYRVRT
jgi:hypothetical protein